MTHQPQWASNLSHSTTQEACPSPSLEPKFMSMCHLTATNVCGREVVTVLEDPPPTSPPSPVCLALTMKTNTLMEAVDLEEVHIMNKILGPRVA